MIVLMLFLRSGGAEATALSAVHLLLCWSTLCRCFVSSFHCRIVTERARERQLQPSPCLLIYSDDVLMDPSKGLTVREAQLL